MNVQFKIPDAPESSIEVREPGASPDSYPSTTVVELDLVKIDLHLSQAVFGYVGPGGSDSKSTKHQRVCTEIGNGQIIDMPVMFASLSRDMQEFMRSVHVGDGRHRLWNLKNMGLKCVSVVVPTFQAHLFTQAFA